MRSHDQRASLVPVIHSSQSTFTDQGNKRGFIDVIGGIVTMTQLSESAYIRPWTIHAARTLMMLSRTRQQLVIPLSKPILGSSAVDFNDMARPVSLQQIILCGGILRVSAGGIQPLGGRAMDISVEIRSRNYFQTPPLTPGACGLSRFRVHTYGKQPTCQINFMFGVMEEGQPRMVTITPEDPVLPPIPPDPWEGIVIAGLPQTGSASFEPWTLDSHGFVQFAKGREK